MKLVGKVPVEPLDDERLTNIERNLVVRVSELSAQRSAVRAPRRLAAFAAVALAVVVAGGVGWKLRGDGTPLIAPAPEQLAMKAGALNLGDAQITGTDFAVTRSADRVEVVMQPGTLDLHVEHRPERLFVVKAGNVEIEDVGTRFSVAYDGKNVDVRVTEGEVKVKHAGKELSVTASNAWTLELGPITIAQLAQRTLVAQQDDSAPAPVADRAPTAAGSGTEGSGSGSATASAGTGSAGATAGSASRTKPGKTDARKALVKLDIAPPIDVGIADARAAINEYSLRAAQMGGDDTSQLLYSMAALQHRMKDDKAALRTLVGVTRREGGKAYRDGMWLEVRIHCLRAFDEDCRRAAERYRNKFASGPATGIADAILAEISRQ